MNSWRKLHWRWKVAANAGVLSIPVAPYVAFQLGAGKSEWTWWGFLGLHFFAELTLFFLIARAMRRKPEPEFAMRDAVD